MQEQKKSLTGWARRASADKVGMRLHALRSTPALVALCFASWHETFSEAPAKTSAQPLAATLLVSRPIFSISIVTESPGLSHRYGVRANPTPWQLSEISAA